MADLLYNRLAVQCKQCGVRYEDTPTGKKLLEEHMDMHFRQNRKASQAVGRGHSRSWFVTMEVSHFAMSGFDLQLNSPTTGLGSR